MTGKADFTEEEWKTILEGPPSAGLVVILSDRGGSIRETFSMTKAYTEARQQHGESELLDEIVAAKPEMDRTRAGSPEELKQHSLDNVRQAIALLKAKASDEEVEEYRKSSSVSPSGSRRPARRGTAGSAVSVSAMPSGPRSARSKPPSPETRPSAPDEQSAEAYADLTSATTRASGPRSTRIPGGQNV